jgi:chromodomain-helicase-DNA-binding protein 7
MERQFGHKDRDDIHWRWTKSEEDAFCKTVGSYGVEFDPASKSLRWGRFKALAKLDKSDEALTDYLKAFMVMCKQQCGLMISEEEMPIHDLTAEPIGEEKAITTLERYITSISTI